MLSRHRSSINATTFITTRDFVEGYYFVTTLLTSIYASMLVCVIVMLIRMIYVAVRRRLKRPRSSSNQRIQLLWTHCGPVIAPVPFHLCNPRPHLLSSLINSPSISSIDSFYDVSSDEDDDESNDVIAVNNVNINGNCKSERCYYSSQPNISSSCNSLNVKCFQKNKSVKSNLNVNCVHNYLVNTINGQTSNINNINVSMDGNSFVSDVPVSQEINFTLSSVNCLSATSVTPLPQLNTLNFISVNDAKDNEVNCYCPHGSDDEQIMSHLTATNTNDLNLQFSSSDIINGKEDAFTLSEHLILQNDQIKNIFIKQQVKQQQQSQQQQVTSKLNSSDFTCAYNCSNLKLHFTSQHSNSLPTFSSVVDCQVTPATSTATENKSEGNNLISGNNDTSKLIQKRAVSSLDNCCNVDIGNVHLSPCHSFNAIGDNLPRVTVTSVGDIEHSEGQVLSENVPTFKLLGDNEYNVKSDPINEDFCFGTLSSTDVTSDELKWTSVRVNNGHGHLLLGNSSNKGSNNNRSSNNNINLGHCTRCNKIRGKHLAHYKSDSCINCSCSS